MFLSKRRRDEARSETRANYLGQPGRTLVKRSLHLDAVLPRKTHPSRAEGDILRREETWLRRETLSENFDTLFFLTGHPRVRTVQVK